MRRKTPLLVFSSRRKSNFELEIGKRAGRVEQPRLSLADREDAVGDVPVGLAVGLPAEHRFAVEQQDPAIGQFVGGQLIVRRLRLPARPPVQPSRAEPAPDKSERSLAAAKTAPCRTSRAQRKD